MRDPYIYPGTETLINFFDIRDPDKLQDLESAFYRLKLAKPLPKGNFDYAHLKNIHKHLFGDIYKWAGEQRTVDIVKVDSYFAHANYIGTELNKLFTKLEHDNYLIDSKHDEFCNRLSYFFNEINAAHPFREGNGRTLRAFCDLLSERAGHAIDWSNVSKEEYIRASILGFNADYKAMEKIFNKIICPLHQHEVVDISNETQNKLKEYVSKQVQLTDIINQKYQFLLSDTAIAKKISDDAATLNQELENIAEELIKNQDIQNLLKQQKIVSLHEQGGFIAINERFNQEKLMSRDIISVLRYAKEQTKTISQNYCQNAERGIRHK